jgi:hypothetical protein
MSVILECNECGRLPLPNHPKTVGEKCDDPKCPGSFQVKVSDAKSPPQTDSDQPPPEQPEMFPKPQFNPRLYTRDQLRDMVEAAYKKAERSYNTHQRDIEDAKKKELMLQTFEEAMST